MTLTFLTQYVFHFQHKIRKSLIQVSKNSVKNLDLEQKYAGNASDVDFIIGVHH